MAIKCDECGHVHKGNSIPLVCGGCGQEDIGKYERVADEIDPVKHEKEQQLLEGYTKQVSDRLVGIGKFTFDTDKEMDDCAGCGCRTSNKVFGKHSDIKLPVCPSCWLDIEQLLGRMPVANLPSDGMELEELHKKFMALSGSEQEEFTRKDPYAVCRIVWLMEGMLRSYRKAYGV